jgi:hypothetical protein
MDPEKQQKEILQAYKNVFLHTPDGQTILKDLLKTSGIFQITGVRDDAELQHLDGSRDMVRRIISILALDEDAILKLAIGDDHE